MTVKPAGSERAVGGERREERVRDGEEKRGVGESERAD